MNLYTILSYSSTINLMSVEKRGLIIVPTVLIHSHRVGMMCQCCTEELLAGTVHIGAS